jgi:hypothetical protein
MPFGTGAASQRGYYAVLSERGEANVDAPDFVRWLCSEAGQGVDFHPKF